VLVEAGTSAESRRLVALGEVKWGTKLGLPHLERLEHAKELPAARGWQTDGAMPVCISGIGGFSPHLVEAEKQGRVRLLTLADVYGSPAWIQRLRITATRPAATAQERRSVRCAPHRSTDVHVDALFRC
jgi:hypothetical protein